MQLSPYPALLLILTAALAPNRLCAQAENDADIFERSTLSGPSTNLLGAWTWRCCRGAHSGTFTIDRQDAGGRFSGRFGNTPSDGGTLLQGRIRGNRIEFTRSSPAWNGGTQQWTAGIEVRNGRLHTVNGRWRGYGFTSGNDDFEATLARPKAPAAPTAPAPSAPASTSSTSSLLGRWQWGCCRGGHSGTFTIQEHRPDGSLRGIFGNSPSDGATPFEGSYRHGVLSFTRHITINGASVTQHWTARIVNDSAGHLKTDGGQWSGYASTPDISDFNARKLPR